MVREGLRRRAKRRLKERRKKIRRDREFKAFIRKNKLSSTDHISLLQLEIILLIPDAGIFYYLKRSGSLAENSIDRRINIVSQCDPLPIVMTWGQQSLVNFKHELEGHSYIVRIIIDEAPEALRHKFRENSNATFLVTGILHDEDFMAKSRVKGDVPFRPIIGSIEFVPSGTSVSAVNS